MGEMCIWWTEQADCEAIGGNLRKKAPAYLRDQYRDRLGRAGRGRLWCALEIEKEIGMEASVNPWPDTALGARLTDFAGIVLRRSDAVHLTTLPGLLTDFHLDRLDT